MATSFISEHSAEYVLVPRLAHIMEQQFSKAIPLYFLSNREGSIIARRCNPFQRVRILNMFARRPKVFTPNQPSIEVKFNESLFEIAELSQTMGIPTFAGVPVVSSVMDFGLDANCIWFGLSGTHTDVHYEISLDGEILSQPIQSSVFSGPLDENGLINAVLQNSRVMIWEEAVENLRTIRRGAKPVKTFWFGFGGGYHPFNFILIDKNDT